MISNPPFIKLTVTYNDGDGNATQTKILYVTGILALEKAQSYTYDVKIGKDKVTIGKVSVADWDKGVSEGQVNLTLYYITRNESIKRVFVPNRCILD